MTKQHGLHSAYLTMRFTKAEADTGLLSPSNAESPPFRPLLSLRDTCDESSRFSHCRLVGIGDDGGVRRKSSDPRAGTANVRACCSQMKRVRGSGQSTRGILTVASSISPMTAQSFS